MISSAIRLSGAVLALSLGEKNKVVFQSPMKEVSMNYPLLA